MFHSDWRKALAAIEPASPGNAEGLYIALADEIRGMERRGEQVPAALRAHLWALDAEIMEARYDNFPV